MHYVLLRRHYNIWEAQVCMSQGWIVNTSLRDGHWSSTSVNRSRSRLVINKYYRALKRTGSRACCIRLQGYSILPKKTTPSVSHGCDERGDKHCSLVAILVVFMYPM